MEVKSSQGFLKSSAQPGCALNYLHLGAAGSASVSHGHQNETHHTGSVFFVVVVYMAFLKRQNDNDVEQRRCQVLGIEGAGMTKNG